MILSGDSDGDGTIIHSRAMVFATSVESIQRIIRSIIKLLDDWFMDLIYCYCFLFLYGSILAEPLRTSLHVGSI